MRGNDPMERVGTGRDAMEDRERLGRDAPTMPGRVWFGSSLALLMGWFLSSFDPTEALGLLEVVLVVFVALASGFGIMVALDGYAEHVGVWDRYWRTKARERARDGAEAGPAEKRLKKHDGRRGNG